MLCLFTNYIEKFHHHHWIPFSTLYQSGQLSLIEHLHCSRHYTESFTNVKCFLHYKSPKCVLSPFYDCGPWAQNLTLRFSSRTLPLGTVLWKGTRLLVMTCLCLPFPAGCFECDTGYHPCWIYWRERQRRSWQTCSFLAKDYGFSNHSCPSGCTWPV